MLLQIAIKGVENIRTVASLTKEETFVQLYEEMITPAYE